MTSDWSGVGPNPLTAPQGGGRVKTRTQGGPRDDGGGAGGDADMSQGRLGPPELRGVGRALPQSIR